MLVLPTVLGVEQGLQRANSRLSVPAPGSLGDDCGDARISGPDSKTPVGACLPTSGNPKPHSHPRSLAHFPESSAGNARGSLSLQQFSVSNRSGLRSTEIRIRRCTPESQSQN